MKALSLYEVLVMGLPVFQVPFVLSVPLLLLHPESPVDARYVGYVGLCVPTSSPFSCHSSLGLNCLRFGHYVLVHSKFQCCAAFVLPLFLDCVYSAITLGGLGGKIKVFNLLFSPRTNHCSLCANASVLQIKCWRSHECILINIYRIDNIKRDWKLGLVAYACYCNTW